ncbi:MAG: nitroreductase family protein [Salinivirgaceae bacterium]|jgi:nitroreductase|nr:nitroreductase family protein [Salinivirgaceae bacterium]
MLLLELIKKTRSFRRFDQNTAITTDQLKNMVNSARLGASGRNQQSLCYKLINDATTNRTVFPLLKWAGFIEDWDGPEEGERPAAYIVVCHNKNIAATHFCDEGIAMQNMLLTATEMGVGGCIIASVDKVKLRQELHIPEHLEILDVVALGKPAEKVVIEDMQDDDYKYWRDNKGVHHVPKRSLDDILF